MNNRKKITLGLLFIAILLLFGWGLNYLKGTNLFHKKNTYYIKYNRVNGLMVSNPVTIKGLKVGKVSDIGFSSTKDPYIIVKIDIDNKLFIPENTIAVIENKDIMGSKKISLRLGDSDRYLQKNDTLNSKIELGFRDVINQQLTPVKAKAESMMQKFDSIFTAFNQILSQKNQDGISNSLSSIEEIFSNIKQTTVGLNHIVNKEQQKLSSILSNVDEITTNLTAQQGKINQSINNMSKVSEELSQMNLQQTLSNLNQTLESVNTLIQKASQGDGSASLFINDDSLYRNLEKASQKMNLLLEDINQNPKKYVHFSIFGRKN